MGYRGAEHEIHADALGFVLQQQGKLPAIGDFVIGQMHRTQESGVGVECRLDMAHLVGTDFPERHAGLAQHLQAWLHQLTVFFRAKQHHVAGAAVVFELQFLRELMQPFPAVKRQALQPRAVG